MGLATFWSHLRARRPRGQTLCTAPKRENEATQMRTAMPGASFKAPCREPAAPHPPLPAKNELHCSLQLLRALPRLPGEMGNSERLYLSPPKAGKPQEEPRTPSPNSPMEGLEAPPHTWGLGKRSCSMVGASPISLLLSP